MKKRIFDFFNILFFGFPPKKTDNKYYLLYVGGIGGGGGGRNWRGYSRFLLVRNFRIFIGEEICLKILIEEDRTFVDKYTLFCILYFSLDVLWFHELSLNSILEDVTNDKKRISPPRSNNDTNMSSSDASMDVRAQECVSGLIKAHSGFKKSFVALMLAMFSTYELKKDIENKRDQFPTLFEQTKTTTGLHAFLQSQDDGFDMQLQTFRAYFAAVGGLVVKYGDHYDSFEELLEFCEITNLKLARLRSKSARQVAFEKLEQENKKIMEAKKQELVQRELDELTAEREQEERARSKRPKLEPPTLAEEAEEAEPAETAVEAAVAAALLDFEKLVEEEDEQVVELTNILSRDESVSSTASLELKMRNFEVRATYDEATNKDKDDTIKLLKRKIRVLKEQVVQMTQQLGGEAVAIADHVAETFPGDTQGDSQLEWLSDEGKEQTPGTSI